MKKITKLLQAELKDKTVEQIARKYAVTVKYILRNIKEDHASQTRKL